MRSHSGTLDKRNDDLKDAKLYLERVLVPFVYQVFWP